MNKIDFFLCHEATMLSTLSTGLPMCSSMEFKKNINVPITTKYAGSEDY